MQWSSTVPPGAPNMVFIAHLKYCSQNGRCWSALHTHYGVCLYTRHIGLHTIQPCALDTAVNIVHNRYLHQIQCAMHSKNCSSTCTSNRMIWTLYIQPNSKYIDMIELQVTKMRWRLRNSCESNYNRPEYTPNTRFVQSVWHVSTDAWMMLNNKWSMHLNCMVLHPWTWRTHVSQGLKCFSAW